MKTNFIGYLGLGFMIAGYLFLNSPYPNMFLILNTISCGFLFFHAIKLKDIPFIVANGLAVIVLSIKYFGGGI
jgi:hypothetical protein